LDESAKPPSNVASNVTLEKFESDIYYASCRTPLVPSNCTWNELPVVTVTVAP
jgi:hypothetical protein